MIERHIAPGQLESLENLLVDRSLSARVRLSLPTSFPISVYWVGWAQASIQLLVFIASLSMLMQETRPLHIWLWAIPFGWSWFALLMVGHDATHRSFSPWKSFDRCVAFLTLDCLLFSERRWRLGHQVLHHVRPNCAEDMMHLRGQSFLQETVSLATMVVIYVRDDLHRLFTKPRARDWIAALFRVSLLYALFPLAILPALFFLILSGNYLGLLPHALPDGRPDDDPIVRQLRAAWDFFPNAPFFAGLITGGLNAHATHHVFPNLPRGAHPVGAAILKDEAGHDYRSISSLKELFVLFRQRHGAAQVAPIELDSGIEGLERR